ncbi:hypothetical protein ACFY36_44910 [Actinoplanes sp. NPDC000266]
MHLRQLEAEPHHPGAGLERLRIHHLRPTHASYLIADNIVLTGIQRRFGHSSITVTSDLYGHLLLVVDENILVAASKSISLADLDWTPDPGTESIY